MSHPGSQPYLESFINYETSGINEAHRSLFKLDRVRRLFELIGNPHQKIKCVHVAGTKGKGSTCAFTASILRAAGKKVGLYTSPHLHEYRERIRVLSPQQKIPEHNDLEGQISESRLNELLDEIKPAIEKVRAREEELGRLSFFEIYTVLALYHFYKSSVDYAVLETGLGGRLDATNVVDAEVSAITPISLEHMKYLGSTVREIAGEKAAIIKNKDQWAVIAPQEDDAARVIANRCAEVGAKTLWVGKDIAYEIDSWDEGRMRFHVRGAGWEYRDLESPLLGKHQAMNAAVAIGMIECLRAKGLEMSVEAVSRGVRDTVWPGRFEMFYDKGFPKIVLDGAHNPASSRILTETVRDIFPKTPTTVIIGVSDDKDKKGIVAELTQVADKIIFTSAGHPRSWHFTVPEIEELKLPVPCFISENIEEAFEIALQETKENGLILVSGSLFVVAEAREICIKSRI